MFMLHRFFIVLLCPPKLAEPDGPDKHRGIENYTLRQHTIGGKKDPLVKPQEYLLEHHAQIRHC
jgi:hypothetical protein